MKNKSIFKLNIIYFLALFLVATIFLLGYTGILQNEYLTTFLIQIVTMFAIPMLMYSLLMKRDIKKTLNDFGLRKISASMVIISILLGFVLYFINSFVADAFYGIITLFGYETISSSSVTTTISYATLLKELVLSCILPGFCEEFLHRGLMLFAKKEHSNPKYCLIISSILFGLTHLNIRQFFYASILGFLIGYTSLVANSIIPGIIIHFMNNFLSNYFFYGSYFNWPLAKFVNNITLTLSSNIVIFLITSVIFVLMLFLAYKYLTRCLLKERAKKDIKTIVKALKMEQLSIEEAQEKFTQVNALLKNKSINQSKNKKFCLIDNIFLISSFVLGTLITISSFIWGVI